MTSKRQNYSPEFKFKIAIEAIKGEKSINELSSLYKLHPKQIQRWKHQLLAEGESMFIHKTTQKKANNDPDKEELLHVINQLSAELEYLKKKLKK